MAELLSESRTGNLKLIGVKYVYHVCCKSNAVVLFEDAVSFWSHKQPFHHFNPYARLTFLIPNKNWSSKRRKSLIGIRHERHSKFEVLHCPSKKSGLKACGEIECEAVDMYLNKPV